MYTALFIQRRSTEEKQRFRAEAAAGVPAAMNRPIGPRTHKLSVSTDPNKVGKANATVVEVSGRVMALFMLWAC